MRIILWFFLQDFKNGAFSLAIQFQIPIAPMSFYDCERKFPYFFAYNYFVGSPGKLRANVHDFIETKGMTQEHIPSLKNIRNNRKYNNLIRFK